MSKLIDRLDHLARGPHAALGFATSSASRERVPSLALLARVSAPKKTAISALSKAGVDAFILSQTGREAKDLEQEAQPLEGHTWGVAVETLEREQMETCKARGGDFVVFGIEGTQADALEEGDTARVLRIPSNLEESTLHSLEDLPIDVVLLEHPGAEGPLTLTHLLAISNVRASMSRYLLLEWDGNLTSRDLEQLQDMGVDGILFDASKADATAFKTVHDLIDGLPKRRPKGEQRPMAVLPSMSRMPGGRSRTEEEEEEEEEYDEEP